MESVLFQKTFYQIIILWRSFPKRTRWKTLKKKTSTLIRGSTFNSSQLLNMRTFYQITFWHRFQLHPQHAETMARKSLSKSSCQLTTSLETALVYINSLLILLHHTLAHFVTASSTPWKRYRENVYPENHLQFLPSPLQQPEALLEATLESVKH